MFFALCEHQQIATYGFVYNNQNILFLRLFEENLAGIYNYLPLNLLFTTTFYRIIITIQKIKHRIIRQLTLHIESNRGVAQYTPENNRGALQ